MHNPYFHLLKTSWHFAEGKRVKMVFTYTLFVFANVVMMAEPYVFGQLLNTIQLAGTDLLKEVFLWLCVYASLTLGFWIFHGTARVFERELSFLIVKNFTEKTFEMISQLPLKWHKDHHSGELINRTKKGYGALKNFCDDGYQFIETIVRFFISLVAIAFFLPKFWFLPVVLGIIIIATIFRFDAFLSKTMNAINEKDHVVTATLFDYIANITTVITLRLEKLAKSEVTKKIMQIFPLYKKNIRMNEMKWFLISIGLALMNFVILYFYIADHVHTGQVILIGNLMALYQYTERFINVFFNLAWQYEKVVWLDTDLKSCNVIFHEHAAFVRETVQVRPVRNWREIEINGLFFTHQDERNRTHHLNDIHLKLGIGRRIAFIGESGSGKSTMLSLIRGLYDADAATVRVDGQVKDSLKVLSNCVTLIPQEPEIFQNTIEYNVTAGIRHTPADVAKAVKLARFDRVLARLPNGLQTNIREKGVNLSGGEKQRLAVARGLFAARKSSILLLDEPTSSVDSENEVAIYNNIFQAFPRTCVISSVHRLNLLKIFDEIYVFQKGRVVEQGSFDALLESRGVFTRMWERYLRHVPNKQKSSQSPAV